MKIQEKSESFYFFPEITCILSHYLDVRIFRYPDIYSDIYNIYSPPKFWRICSCTLHTFCGIPGHTLQQPCTHFNTLQP